MSERYEAEGQSVWDQERQRFVCYTLPAQDDESKRLAERIAAALNTTPQPQTEPVASGEVDEWFDGCEFLVTFDGETTHPMKLGVSLANRDRVTRMVFECAAPQPQPQASAEDVALVTEYMAVCIDAEAHAAWQRIRASLEVGP